MEKLPISLSIPQAARAAVCLTVAQFHGRQNRSMRPVVFRSLPSASPSFLNFCSAKISGFRVDQFYPLRKPGVMRKLGCQEASAVLVGCRVSPCGLVWARLRSLHSPPTCALHTYKT